MANASRPGIRGPHPRFWIALSLLPTLAAPALAQLITTDVSQYSHKAWLRQDGAFTGNTVSVTQTTDGYIWVGSAFGLLRFDGINFTSAWPTGGESLAHAQVRAVVGARDGSLWIGSNGLLHLANGKMTSIPQFGKTPIDTILEDRAGNIWAAGISRAPNDRICRISADLSTTVCFGDTKTLGITVAHLFEDRSGNISFNSDTGLWTCKAGNPDQCSRIAGGTDTDVFWNASNEWVETPKRNGSGLAGGLRNKSPQPILSNPELRISTFLADKHGGLWIGTAGKGIVHSFHGRVDTYTTADGLSSNQVAQIFQDREDNIWVATSAGVDRFRTMAITLMTEKQGLSGSVTFAALFQGPYLWVASPNGLNRITDHDITSMTKQDGLPSTDVHSLFAATPEKMYVSTDSNDGLVIMDKGKVTRRRTPTGESTFVMTSDGAGGVWMSNREAGLVHVPPDSGPVQVFPWSQFENKEAAALVFDPVRHGVWLVLQAGDLELFRDGEVKERYSYPGKQFGNPRDLRVAGDGTVWFGSSEGLTRLRHGKLATLNMKNGLPCDGVQWQMDDDQHDTWLLTPCGAVRLPPGELDRWSIDPGISVRILNYLDNTDGSENAFYGTHYTPAVALTADGRLAYASGSGLAIIDPHKEFINRKPPPVRIDKVEADAKVYTLNRPIGLAANPHVVRIDYNALSFRAPQKSRFRYRLEGYDKHWSEVLSTREAIYTDLPPGSYRFHVIASNDSGIWNETGDTLDFKVRAAFYQTTWFLLTCVAALAFLLWLAYRLRVRYLFRQLSTRIEIQTNERLNVSRDLHDTLLQGVQGMLLSFHALSEDSTLADGVKAKIVRIGDLAEELLQEGRDKIKTLRFEHQPKLGLPEEITRIANTFHNEGSPAFDLSVAGTEVPLNSLVYEETCFICREAIHNAFRHASAQKVEVLISFSHARFSVSIRDDGKGLDPDPMRLETLTGHWGIVGMRERAARIGARLEIRSSFLERAQPGTSVIMELPAAVAYANTVS